MKKTKPIRWTALEVEIRLMEFFGVRQNVIVPNVSWGFPGLHECDLLILSSNNYACEVEIKVSKSDLLADVKKRHGHYNNLIARFFFAVPFELGGQALEVIPPRAGLIVVERDRQALIVRNCKRNMMAKKWDDKQRSKLLHLGNMRILGLKKKIFACKKIMRKS